MRQATPSIATIVTQAEKPDLPFGACRVSRWKGGRFFAVSDPGGALVCVCVCKRGAKEVAKRLSRELVPTGRQHHTPALPTRRTGGKGGDRNGRD